MLIFSVLMLGVILTITLALANIFLPRLKSVGESINSAAAIYAADSVTEWCIYTQRNRQPPVPQPTMSNGATYTIFYGSNPGTCASTESPLNHTLTGTYRGVSRSLKVTTGTTITSAPASIPRGGTVMVTWDNIDNPTSTDWIGLYQTSASDFAFTDWVYVSCTKTPGSYSSSGSCNFAIPNSIPGGTYEFRLFSNNGYTKLATSAPFTITP